MEQWPFCQRSTSLPNNHFGAIKLSRLQDLFPSGEKKKDAEGSFILFQKCKHVTSTESCLDLQA